jgi:secretion/DNA translocation related TadE-like protein
VLPDRREAGAATVWMVGLATLIGLSVSVGIVRGSAALTRHRAEVAADLAALAGAIRVSAGDAHPCAAAERVATRNGGLLTACKVTGEDVDVAVTRRLELGTLGSWSASAHARAGPADRAWSAP